jgi:polar amino acid transport system substrate-binding protein
MFPTPDIHPSPAEADARSLRQAFAPTGVLRAAINVGNPVLAARDDGPVGARGVSVDLAHAFAQGLGLPLALVVVDKAAESVAAVGEGRADIGFFAVDPARAATIAFTAPYVLIEGCYAVREASPIRALDEVDRPGVRVAVAQGSAYDLHLGRALRHAALHRAPTAPEGFALYLERGLDVAAGVRQQLESDLRAHPGHRLLDGRFMVIRQAMGVARGRGPAAAAALATFVEAAKADGSVAAALARHGIEGAAVAAAGDGGGVTG